MDIRDIKVGDSVIVAYPRACKHGATEDMVRLEGKEVVVSEIIDNRIIKLRRKDDPLRRNWTAECFEPVAKEIDPISKEEILKLCGIVGV